MVRSFGLGIPGTRNVYIFVSIVFNAHSNVNITSSRNSKSKRTHRKNRKAPEGTERLSKGTERLQEGPRRHRKATERL